MWKFCPECGHKLETPWKFCADCGKQCNAPTCNHPAWFWTIPQYQYFPYYTPNYTTYTAGAVTSAQRIIPNAFGSYATGNNQ